MSRPEDFSRSTQTQALARQDGMCASCGAKIFYLGGQGRSLHEFGEIGHAHHMRAVRLGGKGDLQNCVIVCEACHYSAHEGGNYGRGTVVGRPRDFPHFNGHRTQE